MKHTRFESECLSTTLVLTFNPTKKNCFQLFDTFGKIVSCVIMKDDSGKSKGFGFVSFETHESAKQVREFNLIYII